MDSVRAYIPQQGTVTLALNGYADADALWAAIKAGSTDELLFTESDPVEIELVRISTASMFVAVTDPIE